MPNYSVPTLIEHGATLLKEYVKAEAKRTDTLKNLAVIVVGIRAKTKDEDGKPDWAGRTAAYRESVQKMYEDAGIEPDSQSGVQAALRYHIGNVLRDKVKPADLARAGLDARGPRERQQARQSRFSGLEPGSAEDGLKTAIVAIQHVASMEIPEDHTTLSIQIMTLDHMLSVLRERLLASEGVQVEEPEKVLAAA